MKAHGLHRRGPRSCVLSVVAGGSVAFVVVIVIVGLFGCVNLPFTQWLSNGVPLQAVL